LSVVEGRVVHVFDSSGILPLNQQATSAPPSATSDRAFGPGDARPPGRLQTVLMMCAPAWVRALDACEVCRVPSRYVCQR